jgi:UDP-GlcNAc:undecaprenyl-phosphate GlcNAc-1-phosphate transferase
VRQTLLCLLVAFGSSTLAILAFWRRASYWGLVDQPGGRKAHSHSVPLVGGLAIFVALLFTIAITGVSSSHLGYFVLALSIIIAVGLWDDVSDISPKIKFSVQVISSVIMIWGAGVELHAVGDLIGWRPIGLGIFIVPVTIFAVVGVVNALNMVDGADGLAGSIALVAFAWYAIVAAQSALDSQAHLATILCGALAGFLVFNFRFPWQPRARVFLGDAGSLMVGFGLAWLAIDLTQGPGRTFPPICALWVLLLPLADCVSLMLRRMRAGMNPFHADSRHIHHYLIARGFTPGQAVATLIGVSITFGAVGYLGWRLALPHFVLFWPFFFGFIAYHLWIQGAWQKLDESGKGADLANPDEQKAFPAA